MNFNAAVKINEKWKTFGRIRLNKWGKPQLSFKVTPELKELVNNSGEWINFALFEEKTENALKPETQKALDDVYKNAEETFRKVLTPTEEQEIPF